MLRSEQFARAPTLAHLLKYLCEKLFAGEARQIKEYSVGVEVFHRGASFDQDADSIVRVEANRLRKRLAAYYAGEGAPHRLHIAIPLGQYVPEFKTRGGAGKAKEGQPRLPLRQACRVRKAPARGGWRGGFVCRERRGLVDCGAERRFCFSERDVPG